MLTAEARDEVIKCSLDELRRRLDLLPLCGPDVSRIYGLDDITAEAIATERERDPVDSLVSIRLIATFVELGHRDAAASVSQWLAGRDMLVRYHCYTPSGDSSWVSLKPPPNRLGPLHAVATYDSFVFRLVAKGYEEAAARGENVPTELWTCSHDAYAMLDQIYDDANRDAAFAAWKQQYCSPVPAVTSGRGLITHVDCTIRATAQLVHELAEREECTALLLFPECQATVQFK